MCIVTLKLHCWNVSTLNLISINQLNLKKLLSDGILVNFISFDFELDHVQTFRIAGLISFTLLPSLYSN